MNLKRRDLFKLAGAGTALLMGEKAAANQRGLAGVVDDALGVLVDTSVCIGCRKCEWACNQAHKLSSRESKTFEDKSVCLTRRRPTALAYTVVNAVANTAQPDKPYYMKIQCLHCHRPACASACLVGALRKTESGPVTYDAGKCMGCRYCMVACPFQIPAYEYSNPLTPRVMKCTFCTDRLAQGNRPACVDICPNEALMFGRRRDLLDIAYTRLRQFPDRYVDHIYGETEIGGTSWLYLSAVDFSKTELPVLTSQAIPEMTETIQHGIFKHFVPPLLLYGLLGLIMISRRDPKQQKGETPDVA